VGHADPLGNLDAKRPAGAGAAQILGLLDARTRGVALRALLFWGHRKISSAELQQ
jgi:hypothetical protein